MEKKKAHVRRERFVYTWVKLDGVATTSALITGKQQPAE
jgi:hypothetical protein